MEVVNRWTSSGLGMKRDTQTVGRLQICLFQHIDWRAPRAFVCTYSLMATCGFNAATMPSHTKKYTINV